MDSLRRADLPRHSGRLHRIGLLRRVDRLRRQASTRLLDSGATMALDGRQMRQGIERSPRQPGPGDLQVLAMIDLMSAVKIRLGMLLMPGSLPRA